MRELGPQRVQIQSLLEHAGLGVFYYALNGVVNLTNHCATLGVVKWFWDTINFHLPFGEMTITPFTFASLMGFGFLRKSLVYQEDLHTHRNQLFHFFSPIIESISHEDHFSCNILVNLMHDDEW